MDVAPAPTLDLGVARYPATTREPPVFYDWSEQHRAALALHLGYALDAAEQTSVQRAHLSFAKTVHAENRGKSTRWQPPPGCEADMRCVYETVLSRSERDLSPLVALFRARADAAHHTPGDLAASVIAFVQHIPYAVPADQPFGVLPPALVVARRQGDCDSKVVLAHGLLRALGIDSLVLSSDAHAHTMLGVALPAVGTKVRLQGRDYAFVELTAKDAPLGYVSPELLRPNDWRVVPVRGVARPGAGPKRTAPPTPTKQAGPIKL